MSKRYKQVESKSGFHILFTAILFLLIAPVIPIAFIFLGILYILGIHSKYPLAFGFIILGCLVVLGYSTIFLTFLYDFQAVASLSIQRVLNADLLGALTSYARYSFTSWLVVVDISLIVAGYFMRRLEALQVFQNVGIKSLNEEVKQIDDKNKQAKQKAEVTVQKSSTIIGINKAKKAVYCRDNAKHVMICGTTGSGKTVALSNFIKRAVTQNYGLLIVDGKGDTNENSILAITRKFCSEAKRKLYVVNMNDVASSAHYNPFASTDETVVKDMLIHMSKWSEEHYKANTERYLQRLAKLLISKGETVSFDSIVKYIVPERFVELSAQLAKDNKITKDMHLDNMELSQSSGKIARDAAARFATIQESQMNGLFQADGIDIYTALKEKAVILFVLNPLLYPETSQALGRLVLVDSKKAVSKMFQGSKERKFFVFDEINVYASPALVDLVNKSRSANVTCFCGAQSLSDMEAVAGESYKNQIIENCNNYLIMRQNADKDAEEWAKIIGTVEKMKMTYKIGGDSDEGRNKGSAKKSREFVVHPDDIKAFRDGVGVFLSRDTNEFNCIKVCKPF